MQPAGFEYAVESHWYEINPRHCFFWVFPLVKEGRESALHGSVVACWQFRLSVGVEILVKLVNSGCVCLRSFFRQVQWLVQPLDGPRSATNVVVRIRKIIDMIAQSHEQVEEDLSPHLHLHLHGTTTLESLATADN